MDDSDLEQIAQLDRVNRQALLAEGAQRVDALINGALGGNDGTVAASAEGDLLRALQEDEAKFADFPQVYRITDQDFLAKKLEAPITFKPLARDYRFYWVRFPIT